MPAEAGNTAYETPLIVLRWNATVLPFQEMELRAPESDFAGNMARSPFAPEPTLIVKVSADPFHASDENDEPLRPSSQVSNCAAEISGTPRDCAESIMSSAP